MPGLYHVCEGDYGGTSGGLWAAAFWLCLPSRKDGIAILGFVLFLWNAHEHNRLSVRTEEIGVGSRGNPRLEKSVDIPRLGAKKSSWPSSGCQT